MLKQPWLKHYPENIDWEYHIDPKPLYKLFEEAAAQARERNYLDFMGRKFTYEEIANLIDRAAKGLREIGVHKGVKVGLFLPNCPQYVICFFGVLKAGGTVVQYSPLYSKSEIANQVKDSETDIMITLDLEALYPKAKEQLVESRLRKLIVASFAESMPLGKRIPFELFRRRMMADVEDDDRHMRLKELLDNEGDPQEPEIDPHEDIACLQYTGGTTGTPKGAMLTHANLYANAMQVRAWDPEGKFGDEKVVGVLPMFHAFALTCALLQPTSQGWEIILHPRFRLDDLLKSIDRKKPHYMPGVPTMFNAINHHEKLSKYDLSSLRACISGGAPLPPSVKNDFEELTGARLLEGYGLTETSPVVSCAPLHGLEKEGSIGLPLPGTTITILDQEDPAKEMPLGETGELAVEGPQVMKGYWNQPQETAQSLINGRFLTGDLGFMDEDGYTFIKDRKKNMILASGFNVYPRTVEDAITKHPDIKEAVVIGIPDEYRGETPKAFIVTRDGQEIDTGELQEFLEEYLGKHEIPDHFEFRDELPKTAVGKPSRKELEEEEEEKRDSDKADQ